MRSWGELGDHRIAGSALSGSQQAAEKHCAVAFLAKANSFVRRRQIGMCGCTEWNVHQQRSERLLFCFGSREMPIALTRGVISTRDLRFT